VERDFVEFEIELADGQGDRRESNERVPLQGVEAPQGHTARLRRRSRWARSAVAGAAAYAAVFVRRRPAVGAAHSFIRRSP